jgi:radical SAM superfamily enzyme YgiQ (UPF0313 family)
MYTATRVSDIKNKTVEQLRKLKDIRVNEISLGVESGDDWTLKRINKGYTAALYDGLHMTMVNTSMLTVVPGTPLYRAMEKGLYTESTEKEKLEEIHELVRCLSNDTIFMNEHASNLFHVQCRLPEAKEELLAYIQKFMESSDEKELRQYRERVTRAFR